MSLGPTVIYAILGGLLPALLWLWFFLREDKLHPEPRWLLLVSFLAGVLAVIVVLPLEMAAKCLVAGSWPSESFLLHLFSGLAYCRDIVGVSPVILWAAIEELVKFGAAVALVLWHRAVDEPIDAMIYLITIALGFAAFETGLFLMDPFGRGDILGGILTGNLRFMGAALIHTLSSAVVGFGIAYSFYRSRFVQFVSLCTGLIGAVVLHALFNHHIITSSGGRTALVFFLVWLGVIVLFLLFERAKRVTPLFTR